MASSLVHATDEGRDKPKPPPKHVKFRYVMVGPDSNRVVAIVCHSPKGELLDAYLTLSSGDDEVDTRALEHAKSMSFKPLISDGKPVDTCHEVIVHPKPEKDPATTPAGH
jgi:hypothetical protein